MSRRTICDSVISIPLNTYNSYKLNKNYWIFSCMKCFRIFLSLLLQNDREFLYYLEIGGDNKMQLNEIHILVKTYGQKLSFKKKSWIFKTGEGTRNFYLLEEGWSKDCTGRRRWTSNYINIKGKWRIYLGLWKY